MRKPSDPKICPVLKHEELHIKVFINRKQNVKNKGLIRINKQSETDNKACRKPTDKKICMLEIHIIHWHPN